MKRPAFQFYTKDWLGNKKLRRCSREARATWIDVLCLMHDCEEEYGVLRWPLSEIADAAHAPVKLLRELVDKKVLKGSDGKVEAYVHTPRSKGKLLPPVTLLAPCDGPCWYSSRMLKDEWGRGARGASTRFGPDNPPPTQPRQDARQTAPPSHVPSQPPSAWQGDGASSASSVSLSSIDAREESAAPPVDKPRDRNSSSPQTPGSRAAAKTQAMLAEQRAAADRQAPMPETVRTALEHKREPDPTDAPTRTFFPPGWACNFSTQQRVLEVQPTWDSDRVEAAVADFRVIAAKGRGTAHDWDSVFVEFCAELPPIAPLRKPDQVVAAEAAT